MAKSNGKTNDLTKLNWYWLQKALYEAHGLYDQPATRQQGRKLIEAVYEEYERRGVVRVQRPTLG